MAIDLDATEIWRQIPPEEKFDLMAAAQAKGIFAAFILITAGCTVAIGLHLGWMIWASLIASPFVYQFAAGKAWRDLRPRLIMEFLAARSAARRYAFAANGKDLTLVLIFRGRLGREFSSDQAMEALESALDRRSEIPVWIALFRDSVIMISEAAGGARCEFASLIGPERLSWEAINPGKNEYTNGKVLVLTAIDKRGTGRRFRLKSRSSAALVVFEKRLAELTQQAKEMSVRQLEAPPANPDEGRDSYR